MNVPPGRRGFRGCPREALSHPDAAAVQRDGEVPVLGTGGLVGRDRLAVAALGLVVTLELRQHVRATEQRAGVVDAARLGLRAEDGQRAVVLRERLAELVLRVQHRGDGDDGARGPRR